MHGYYHFFRNRELNEIYTSLSIRAFALSMISVFVPIYLLQLGYSLTSVLIFYVVLNGIHALFVIPAAKISSRFGFKHSILFSIPLLIIFFLLLFTIKIYDWPLYFLAIIFGLNNSLFWIGYHVDFSKFSKKKHRGEEVGFARIFSSFFSMIGPLIGGVILAFISFKFLFIVVSLLLFVSVIPLFYSKDIHDPINFSTKRIFTDQKLKNYFSFFGYGVETGIAFIIWPIFIFFSILNDFTSLGFIITISSISSLIFVFFIGKFSDKKRRLVLKIGAFFNAIIWGLKTFAKTFMHVFILDFFHGMTRTAISVPFDALSYDKANESDIVEFIIFRETIIQVGRVILFISMMFVADLAASFIFGGGGASLLLWFF